MTTIPADLDADAREEKLPQWVREKLARLRHDLRHDVKMLEALVEGLQQQLVAAAAEVDPGEADSDIHYETDYSTRHLGTGGTVVFDVGEGEDVRVHASAGGISVLASSPITINPRSGTAVQINVNTDTGEQGQ